MSVAISVIIPYFNSSRTILETVKSLEKQSFKAFEVIIVDDGSTMEEAAQLSLLESNKLNYLMLKQENKGATEARNYGAQCAKGSYLIFLDSDDIIAPTYLEKCFNILEGNKNIKLVYSLARRFDASDEPWQLGDFHEFKDILHYNMIPIIAMHRKNDFFSVGQFDKNLSFFEDWDLWIRLLKDGGRVFRINEVLFYYRMRKSEDSLTNFKDKNNFINIINKNYIYNKYIDDYNLYYGAPIDWLHNNILLKNKFYNAWNKKIERNFKNILKKLKIRR